MEKQKWKPTTHDLGIHELATMRVFIGVERGTYSLRSILDNSYSNSRYYEWKNDILESHMKLEKDGIFCFIFRKCRLEKPIQKKQWHVYCPRNTSICKRPQIFKSKNQTKDIK